MTFPVRPETMAGVLQALTAKLGEDCITEGLQIWGHTHVLNQSRPNPVRQEDDRKLVELFLKLQKLTPSKLQLVEELVDHLR
jgi:hypothetical protein